MTAALTRSISKQGLDEYRDFLLSVARPTVELIAADTAVTPTCSKFGGVPDLPADFEWPQSKFGPYRFLGQFNLADIPKGPHGLPSDGLLSFFYAHDENGESFWGDPDYVRAFRFDNVAAFKPTEPPKAVRLGTTVSLQFMRGSDVPPWPHGEARKVWPINDSRRDAYWKLRLRLHPSGCYLRGYPLNATLAFDPTPGPDWRSLLTLRSDTALHWNWHDGDRLVTFIEEQRLQAADFSRIDCLAG